MSELLHKSEPSFECGPENLTDTFCQSQLCPMSQLIEAVMHICVSNVTSISSDNGLSPGRRQAIIWTNAGILLILIEIHTFCFKKIHLKMSSAKWRPFCLGLNVLTTWPWPICQKRIGTSWNVPHIEHNSKSILGRDDSQLDCLQLALAYSFYFV